MADRSPEVLDLLRAAHAPLLVLADAVDEDTGWTATRLPGWTVRDLLLHLASDAQRALVALFTPAAGDADTDEVDYWRAWTPGSDGARAGLRGTRTIASQWSSVQGPAGLFAETARALHRAAAAADPTALVATQGHRLRIGALLRTVVVEAAVHHLDLGSVVAAPPHAAVLGEVRRVLDGLLGRPAPLAGDDVRWILVATGRAAPSEAERAALGADAGRLPLFG